MTSIPLNANIKTVSDLREKTASFIAELEKSEKPTLVFKGSRPKMIALSLAYYQKLMEMIEDYEDAALASELISSPERGGKTLEEVAEK